MTMLNSSLSREARHRWERPDTPAARRHWRHGPAFPSLTAVISRQLPAWEEISRTAGDDFRLMLAHDLEVADALAELERELAWAAEHDPDA